MKELVMKQTSIAPSLRCNLRCRLCASASPYSYLSPMSLERLVETVDRYFSVVSYVEKLAVGGGEPMIYPYLAGFIDKLSCYSERAGMIEIITNGTTVPKEDVISAIKKIRCDFRVLIDNYGTHLSKKIDELSTVLNDAGIRNEIRNYTSEDPHYGGWVDFGNLSVRKHTEAEARMLYAMCAYPQKMKFCFTVVDGVMYPCSPVRRCRELGTDNPSDYLDLFDDKLSIEEKRGRIVNIYNGNFLTACEYCNGMCDDSPRFVPAEQIPISELIEKNDYINVPLTEK